MSGYKSAALSAAGALFGAMGIALAAQAQSRGELLYNTHCIACHTTQLHWRDKKVATDWNSLKAQVRRWQAAAMLGWNESDIVDVARHLNGRFYHFTQPSDSLSGVGGHPRQPDHFTSVTGTSTRCSTFVAIEPSSSPEMAATPPAPRPRVPMMTWSQRISCA